MLSRFGFGNRSVAPSSSSRGSGHSRGQRSLTLRPKDTQLEQHVTKNAERELYKYNTPTQELGMTDLIKQHKPGERFLYAALTTNQEEEDSSRLRRMLNFQPKLNRQSESLDDLPHLELYQETETFSLSDAISGVKKKESGNSQNSKYKKPKKYILVKEVVYLFGALVSTEAEFSKLQISLLDNRMLNDKVAKKVIANTNIMSQGMFHMDYCFPEDALDQMSLSISRESQFLEEGSQWGVIQVRIQYQRLDFPVQTSNAKILAVNRLPQSILEDQETNPNVIDISTLENNRKELQDMYMHGDITNEGMPITEKSEKARYAKSTISGPRGAKSEYSGVPVSPEWGFMKDARSTVRAGDNSIEPSEEGSIRPPTPPVVTQPKSILKSPRTILPEDSVSQFQPRRVQVEELNDDDSPMAQYRH